MSAVTKLLVLLFLTTLSAHQFGEEDEDGSPTSSRNWGCGSGEIADWIKHVHIVSMTHLDIGGWGPSDLGRAGCEDDCRFTADICNTYIDLRLIEAARTAMDLKNKSAAVQSRQQSCPTVPISNQSLNCAGYKKGFVPSDCEAVDCCVDYRKYQNATHWENGWCFPKVSNQTLNPTYVYQTHPFLVQEYFEGSAHCGNPLSTRNATEVAAVAAAIRSGDIAWHAKAFTMIHELCDPDIFTASLKIARSLNDKFDVQHGTIAGKMTDLPGVSIGIVPLLAQAGIKALHIGTNGIGKCRHSS
jgi:hypothetical protein